MPRPQFKHAKPVAKSKQAFQGVAVLVVIGVVAVAAAAGYGWYRFSQIKHRSLLAGLGVGTVQNILIVGSDSRAARSARAIPIPRHFSMLLEPATPVSVPTPSWWPGSTQKAKTIDLL